MKKKLALVNYHDPFFWSFTQRLQADGFEVYWINSRPISSNWMRTNGASPDRICDILEGTRRVINTKEAEIILSEYEQDHLPTINSIIFMDQNLRNAAYADALLYLADGAIKIREFLENNDVGIVSSGRDTALQMITMLVCKKLGIWWGCVTRTKLPKEWFGFSPTQQGDEFIPLREVEQTHCDIAEKWLIKYRSGTAIKPYARPKIGGIWSFLKGISHAGSVFVSHVFHMMQAGSDKKVPGAQVSLHIRRYVRELRNYCHYRLSLKFDQPSDEPFVLYGLHRQPESSIDVRGAFFDDQLALIKQIVRSLPVTHKLYVKVHFSDVAGQSPSSYRALKRFPGVKLIDPDVDSRTLIMRASVIITNVGAMGQEGGYLGRPVIAMSKMFWCNLPTVVHCGTPAELPRLVSRMISLPPEDNVDAIVRSMAGYIANSFPCDPNLGFMNPSFTSQELDELSDAYGYVYQLLSQRMSAIPSSSKQIFK